MWSVTDGDFSRYVLGSNSNDSTDFLKARRSTPRPRPLKDQYESALASLPNRLRKHVEAFVREREALERATLLPADEEWLKQQGLSLKDFKQAIVASTRALRRKELRLQKAFKRRDLRLGSLLALGTRNKDRDQRPRILIATLQDYILARVCELGWSIERFGQFDTQTARSDRMGGEPERIGKKYQWIALHEVLARCSDNFHFEEKYSEWNAVYEGPWQLGCRTIDPSIVPSPTTPASVARWSPHPRSPDYVLSDKASIKAWLRRASGIPDPKGLIVGRAPDGIPWVNLDAHFDFPPVMPPTDPLKDRYAQDRCNLWLMLKSYFVRSDDAPKFIRWASRQHFMGRWMPEPPEDHELFLGEYFWHPAYTFMRRRERGFREWTVPSDEVPYSLMVPLEIYSGASSDLDRSLVSPGSVRLPCRALASTLSLTWHGNPRLWLDASGRVATLDRQGAAPGELRGLQIRLDLLRTFLRQQRLSIVWTALAEKQVLGRTGGVIDRCPRMEYSGTYWLDGDVIEGGLTNHLRRWDT